LYLTNVTGYELRPDVDEKNRLIGLHVTEYTATFCKFCKLYEDRKENETD